LTDHIRKKAPHSRGRFFVGFLTFTYIFYIVFLQVAGGPRPYPGIRARGTAGSSPLALISLVNAQARARAPLYQFWPAPFRFKMKRHLHRYREPRSRVAVIARRGTRRGNPEAGKYCHAEWSEASPAPNTAGGDSSLRSEWHDVAPGLLRCARKDTI